MKKIYLSNLYVLICLLSFKSVAQMNPRAGVQQQTANIMAIHSMGKNITLNVDFVEMLTGKAAVAAAKKTGEADYDVTAKGDTTWYVLNDYVISNDNKKIRKFELAANAQIYLVKEGTSQVGKSTIAKLKRSFEARLFRLSIANNKVIKIVEIYLP